MFLTLLNNVVRCISGHASSCENYVVVQLLSRVQLFVTPWTATCQVSLSFQRLPYVPELAQTHVHQVDEAIQPSHPLLPPSPPALNLSQHQGPFQ